MGKQIKATIESISLHFTFQSFGVTDWDVPSHNRDSVFNSVIAFQKMTASREQQAQTRCV